MRRQGGLSVAWAAVFLAHVALAAPATVENLRVGGPSESPRQLVVALGGASPFRVFSLKNPDRLVLDVLSARLGASALPLPAGAGVIRQVRAANRLDGSVRIVLDLAQAVEPAVQAEDVGQGGRHEILISWNAAVRPAVPAEPPVPAEPLAAPAVQSPAPPPMEVNAPAQPPAGSEIAAPARGPAPVAAAPAPASKAIPRGRDIVIAVDAGHGGKDPGAHGPRGVLEKDVTLRIARRLVEAINAEPGMRGVLTRSRDEFVPLRGRMERARAAQADLFVSVHADAVRNRQVKGASVYVLNEKGATDEAARRLAARENAADLIGGVSLKTKDKTLASVLLDLSQNASLSSSIEVADDILEALAQVGVVRKQRVMQAPFMVLKSPDVPSVLVETAYISNPEEERQLNSEQYRGELARAIFAGVRDYFYRNPPQGTLVAELNRQRLAGNRQHVTRPGESLSAIATRYNVSVGLIRSINGLSSDRIEAGQVLRIPATQST